MKIGCRILPWLALGGALSGPVQSQEPAPLSDASPLFTIGNADATATDDLGRTLPTFEQTGPPKPNRWVGMFFWQWHGDNRWLEDYDVSQFLKTHPHFRNFEVAPEGKPAHPTWYWAQPIFGYYRSTDPWVMRKQLMMLADAGVDFLFLDYTNSQVYDAELEQLLKVARELKNAGVAVPRLTFFLNSQPEWKEVSLYNKWYKPGQYDDLWFRWKGKPLLMAAPISDSPTLHPDQDAAIVPEIQQYFTWRPTWAFGRADKTPGMWRFLHGYNPPLAIDADGQPEQVVVAKSSGGPINNNFKEGGVSAIPGKTFSDTDYNDQWLLPDYAQGVSFQAHWDNARKLAPPITLVAGWNEWTASVWNQAGVPFLGPPNTGPYGYFVDEFNMQFNRDIEPMKAMPGGTFDNYYWQFVANMRLYKGMEPPQPVGKPRSIQVDGSFADWNGVTPLYKEAPNDSANRDATATVPNIHYVDASARNDFAVWQVARDAKTVAFHVQTAAPITAPTGNNWMLLFIDADNNPQTGWNGYDLLLNRSRKGQQCSIERATGRDWNWKATGMAQLAVRGRDLEIALPRALFGTSPLKFAFKWADNLPAEPTLEDFYTEGDVAPDTRFNSVFDEGAIK